MNTPKRYHPLLVTLHWLTVLLMFGAAFLAEDHDRSPINTHMILGALLLLVLLVRVVVRFSTKKPEWADTGNAFLNQVGKLIHVGLYLASFLILSLGALIAYNRNLIGYVMGTTTSVGRAGFIGNIHQLGWVLAVMLILAHIGAALYHQFIIKDNLLARMWYGK